MIVDLFEQSNLLDVELKEAKVSGANQLEIISSAKKYKANPNEEIEMEGVGMQIGFLDAKGDIVSVLDVKIDSGENKFKLAVDSGVTGIFLDINKLIIDPNVDNNRIGSVN